MSDPDIRPDSADEFERGWSADPIRFSFVLYVAGATSRSLRAIENARAMCEKFLHGRYELKIVDVYKNPAAARDGQIVAVPTLVRKLPAPLRRAIGDLSSLEQLIASFSLAT
ncbi:MAG TPA: circadian clock KaiB family protein [Casimicrobiaceae bacterium]|nr:circadian clock KaiB family protein [Casimicrobiaceae bacterium]